MNSNIILSQKNSFIDKKGISDSWKYSRYKNKINYKKREFELLKLLDKHRSKHYMIA